MSDEIYKIERKIFGGPKSKDVFTFLKPLNEKGGIEIFYVKETSVSAKEKLQKEAILAIGPIEAKQFDAKKTPQNRKMQNFQINESFFSSTVFKKGFEITKQLTLSAAIFGVLFLALNWSAYVKIFETKYNQVANISQANTMQEFIAPKKPIKQTLLKVGATPAEEKKNIPALSIAVAPPDTRIIIPSINKNIPVIQISDEKLIKKDFKALEADIQKGLEDGVINYPGTSKPGEHGNIVITGHSSYFPWQSGRFKDVFAILSEVKDKDKIAIFYNQKKYIYTVFEITEVSPKDIGPLQQTKDDILTLITCTPVGTDLRRLIVKAKLTSVEI
ncbi:MAG: sortase [Candidatus Peregrinibacteria bacterium GW2011_GWF2_38_29]|nr:MAG: sortase [Candidatus Peregrinibacteria bacterium GW2011_GWF2_38_29]HBB02603.1 hypothetical protein [Candidatus Peregrinibacteria bacterium]